MFLDIFGLKRNKLRNIEDAYIFIADILYNSGDELYALETCPKEVKNLFVVMDVFNEVANGGFVQALIINSTKNLFNLCYDAYDELDLTDMSEICKNAMDFLSHSGMTFKIEYDIDEISQLYDEINFDEFDEKLMSFTKLYEEKIGNYYKNNKDIIDNFIKENHPNFNSNKNI